MLLKFTLTAVCLILLYTSHVFPQCTITPQTSVTGSRCVGSELRINSNILPESVTWERNGSLVSTQVVTLNANATTVAGGNGSGNAMNQLSGPDRLYVDAAGVLYIPDLSNNRVQKWLPGATSGVTVAGGNGAGAAANQFSRPSSCFVDAQGNIYVTDQNNKRVQKWAPGATTGTTAAGLNNDLLYPTDVFIDKNGNMYVSDQLNYVVRKYAPGSQTGTVVAGNFVNGTGAESLNAPTGIFVDDADNLYVCDTDNGRVQKFAPGSLTGVTIAAGFTPLDVSVDCDGNVFIIDYWSAQVVKYAPGSPTGITVAGGNGSGNAANQLNTPIGVFIIGNNSLYVADYGNHRVQRFSTSIDPRFTANLPGTYSITVNYPCCPSYNEIVEIYDRQIPLVDITATSTSICPGEEVIFTAANTNGILDAVYQWKLNDAIVGNNSTTYLSSTLKENDRLYCILSSLRACTLPGADTSNVIQMDVFTPVPLQLDDIVQICPGADTILAVPAIYDTYTWQDNSTQSTLSVNQQGKYYVTVTDICNTSFSDTIVVSFHVPPTNFLQKDTTICTYDILTLTPAVDLSSYLWSDQSTASSLIVDQPGLYWLHAIDRNNCPAGDSVFVQFKTCPPKGLYMPNAFSPNNNGRNDVFKPSVFGVIDNYKLSIYNRYGQIVFQSSIPAVGWNGTFKGQMVNAGVYVWVCQYEAEGQKPVVEKGTVVVVR